MDTERFDSLTRLFATGANRRGILKGLFGGAVAVVSGALTRQNAGATAEPGIATCLPVRNFVGSFCIQGGADADRCCEGYVCTDNTVFGSCTDQGCFAQDPHTGCQCNTATGFVQEGTQCVCPSGCVIGGQCADASHCEEQCIEPGQACNACHQCCEGSECTKPDAACTGPENAGVCCISNGNTGNTNHPDLCCSGCLVDGTCADASHCEQQCIPAGGTCNQFHPCCHPGVLECTSTTDAEGTCVEVEPCSGGTIPCGQQCIDPTTQCCADEEIGILCQASGFKSKCCPEGHQCHRHEQSKTFDCRTTKNSNGNTKHRSKGKEGTKH